MRKNRFAITIYFLCFLCFGVSFPSLRASAEWETMQFGSYPQSKVEDDTIIAALNALSSESGVTVTYGGNQYVSKASDSSLNWYLVEPITWIILQKDGDTAFVMSEKILDACALKGKWSDSTARTFLNETFYNAAFTAEEQACITTSVIQYTSGKNTYESTDKLFYPSRKELKSAEYGFSSAADRKAGGTKYSGQSCYLTRDVFAVLGRKLEYAVYGWNGAIVYVSASVEWGARPCMRVNYTQAKALEKTEEYNLENATVTLSKTSYTYNGYNKKPGVTVKYNGTKLKKGTDYTVTYIDNLYVGTAKVQITGKGQYTGTVEKTFTIKSPGKIKVTLNPNGGSVSKTTLSVSRGKQYGDLPVPKRSGYTFLGWYTSKTGGSEIVSTAIVEVSKKQTLYAHWKATAYSITYNYNGGTASGAESATYTYGKTLKLATPASSASAKQSTPARPSKTGYYFSGWYTTASFKSSTLLKKVESGTTGALVLYAKWTPITYNVQFDGNGATSGSMSTVSSRKYGLSYTLPKNKFKRTGYTFTGWSTKKTGSVKYTNKATYSDLTSKDGKTVTLYAVWEPTEYAISYVAVNSSTKETLSIDARGENPGSYTVTKAVTLKDSTVTGYIFKGWYSDSSLTKKVTGIKKGSSTGKVTFYASFEPITYTIKFNSNNVISDVPDSIKCTYGETYTIPGSSSKGFLCWNTQADGNGTNYQEGDNVTNLVSSNGGTVNLYAIRNTIESKINAILSIFPSGSYFTANGKQCSHSSGDSCDNCKLSNVLKTHNCIFNSNIHEEGWTCFGFANYCFGEIFQQSYRQAVGVISGGVSYQTFSKAKIGDFLYCFKNGNVSHYAIFISCDENGVTLLHNNIGGNGKVGTIRYGYVTYSSLSNPDSYGYDRIDIYRASNYSQIE